MIIMITHDDNTTNHSNSDNDDNDDNDTDDHNDNNDKDNDMQSLCSEPQLQPGDPHLLRHLQLGDDGALPEGP